MTGHAIRERESDGGGAMNGLNGCDLRIRKAGIARVRSVRTTQSLRIEGADAFLIGADDTVREAVHRIARGRDGIAQSGDFRRAGPATVLLEDVEPAEGCEKRGPVQRRRRA